MTVLPAPDDTEINQEIADATWLNEALFTIAEKYGARVTNNYERWQDGVYLREVGEFIGDVLKAVSLFPAPKDRAVTIKRVRQVACAHEKDWREVESIAASLGLKVVD